MVPPALAIIFLSNNTILSKHYSKLLNITQQRWHSTSIPYRHIKPWDEMKIFKTINSMINIDSILLYKFLPNLAITSSILFRTLSYFRFWLKGFPKSLVLMTETLLYCDMMVMEWILTFEITYPIYCVIKSPPPPTPHTHTHPPQPSYLKHQKLSIRTQRLPWKSEK